MGFVDFVIAVKRRHVFRISLPCANHLSAALANRLDKTLNLFFVHRAAPYDKMIAAARGLHVFPYSTPSCDGRTARRLTAFAAALAILLLSACDPPPLVTAVDTLCVSTSRPVITEAQRAAFRADQALWEPLVDWLAGFLKVRDGACLKPAAG